MKRFYLIIGVFEDSFYPGILQAISKDEGIQNYLKEYELCSITEAFELDITDILKLNQQTKNAIERYRKPNPITN